MSRSPGSVAQDYMIPLDNLDARFMCNDEIDILASGHRVSQPVCGIVLRSGTTQEPCTEPQLLRPR
jgi:hypothetical protein